VGLLQPLQVWEKGKMIGLRLSVPTAHCPVDPADVAAIEGASSSVSQ